MHRGSRLSPLMFVLVMLAVSCEFRLAYRGNCYLQMIW